MIQSFAFTANWLNLILCVDLLAFFLYLLAFILADSSLFSSRSTFRYKCRRLFSLFFFP